MTSFLDFIKTHYIVISTLLLIIRTFIIFIISVIALFIFWHLQQSFTINLLPRIKVLYWCKRILNLAFIIRNNSRVRIRKPVTILTIIYYKKDFFNYLIRRGIGGLEEFIPIGIESKDELINLTYIFLNYYDKKEYLCRLKRRIRKNNYIKNLLAEKFKQEMSPKLKEMCRLKRRIIKCNYIKKLIDHYRRTEIFLEQFHLNNIEEFSKLKEYIVEIKSNKLLKTTKNIYPKETIKIERVITLRKDTFVHLGLQIKSRGLFGITSRTLTAFYGLN